MKSCGSLESPSYSCVLGWSKTFLIVYLRASNECLLDWKLVMNGCWTNTMKHLISVSQSCSWYSFSYIAGLMSSIPFSLFIYLSLYLSIWNFYVINKHEITNLTIPDEYDQQCRYGYSKDEVSRDKVCNYPHTFAYSTQAFIACICESEREGKVQACARSHIAILFGFQVNEGNNVVRTIRDHGWIANHFNDIVIIIDCYLCRLQ